MQNKKNILKKLAYTLAEISIVMMIISVIAGCFCVIIRKGDYKSETCKKAGLNALWQLNFASKQILAKYSTKYNMTGLKTLTGDEFSINDEGADAKLAPLYKKVLGSRTYTPPSGYTDSNLTNENDIQVGSYKVSSFTQGFQAKNGTYVAFKLNGNCTTGETTIYDPSTPELRTSTKSCGLIFFDTNADDSPNTIGIDQYIVSITKQGVK